MQRRHTPIASLTGWAEDPHNGQADGRPGRRAPGECFQTIVPTLQHLKTLFPKWEQTVPPGFSGGPVIILSVLHLPA